MVKKITSLFLCLMITIGIYVIVPKTMTIEANENTRYESADMYVADCITYGLIDPYTGTSQTDSHISMSILHNYTYKNLSEALIEDEARVISSQFWNTLKKSLGGEFAEIANWQEAFYILILMDYLNYSSNTDEYKDNLSKNTVKFANKIYGTILNNATDTYYENVDELIKNTSLTDAVEFSNKYGYTVKLKEFDTLTKDIIKISTNATEYYNNLSKALAVQKANEDRVNFLIDMKTHANNNQYFITAVDQIVEWYTASYSALAFDTAVQTMMNYAIEATFDCMVNAFPMLKTIVGNIKLCMSGLNWLFNTDKASENNLKLLVLYITNSYAVGALQNCRDNYLNSRSEENAIKLNSTYLCFLNYQKYASNHTKGFVTSALFDGIFNKIKNFFSNSNELTHQEFQSYLDTDIKFCQNMISIQNNLYDFYMENWGNTIDIIIDSSLNGLPSTSIDITNVEFAANRFTMFKNYTLTNPAVAYPSNATNKSITYYSGNTNIAIVNQSGVITPVNFGIVTIYAKANNGVTGSCTITILPFEASESNNTYTITKYVGSGGAVNIPSYVNGKPVVTIDDNAFYYGCRSLTSITIPDSVTSIGEGAFRSCSSLTSITIDDKNNNYSSENGVLFNKDKSSLIRYPENKEGSYYTIPNSVTSMGYLAFGGCRSLTSITIPDSVTSINDAVFESCSSLTSVTIPDSVTSIGDWAFSYCPKLTRITIPDSVTSIGDGAFYDCTSLTSITIGNGVTSIGDYAFSGCSSLTSISIPNGVTRIGEDAFFYCSSLISITIPDSVTIIDWYAFNGCSSLTNITIPDNVTSIGDYAFDNCEKLTIYCNIGNVSDILSSTKYVYKCFGDFDDDKQLSSTDAVKMRKSLLGERDSLFDEKVADINQDNKFNVKDLVRLKKQIAGIVA